MLLIQEKTGAMEFTVEQNIVFTLHVVVNIMVTRTLDPRKLPRLCVGERCKRFHAKTWGRAGVGHTEFSRERRQVFPMQSWSSGGVGQCLRSA